MGREDLGEMTILQAFTSSGACSCQFKFESCPGFPSPRRFAAFSGMPLAGGCFSKQFCAFGHGGHVCFWLLLMDVDVQSVFV